MRAAGTALLLLSGLGLWADPSALPPAAAPPGAAPPAAPVRKAPAGSELEKAADEFRLQTRQLGLRADSPRTARSGKGASAPRWHGRLFENLRNDIFDALPHEIRQRNQNKSLLRRNQFGFNVAGPVVLPHLFNGARSTFFSVSYEGMRERISRSTLRTVPTLPERSGDFSSTVDPSGNPLPVYDPQTTRANPGFDPSAPVSAANLQYLRDPFPGNRIPVTRLSQTARQALELYPAPNASAGPFFRNNYFVVSPETNIANGMIVKLDHSARDRHRFDASMAFSNGFHGSANIFPTAADPASPDRRYTSRDGSVRHQWTLSPRTLHTLSGSVNSSGSVTEGELFPVYRVYPYQQMGREGAVNRSRRHNLEFEQGLATRKGTHSLRLTGGITHSQYNSWSDSLPLGAWRFGSGLTSLPGIVNTGHPFASFLLGLPERVERTVITAPSYFRSNRLNYLLSDSWDVRRGLTLSFSGNFEIYTPQIEKHDRQSTVDLMKINPANGRPGAMVVAGHNSVGRSFQPLRRNFEPTAGIAWNVFSSTRTVLRASWSRRTGGYRLTGGQFGTQAFNASPTWISPNAQTEPAMPLDGGLPPSPALPDLRPEAVNGIVADLIDRTDRQPQTESAQISIEREIAGSILLSAGYYHRSGYNLLIGNGGVNVNGIPLDALVHRDKLNDESFRRSLRPFPQYLGFDVNGQYPEGSYVRDAGYLRVEKRTSHGLGLSAYYEWSKQLDDYSGPYGVQDPVNRRNEWSRTLGVAPGYLTLSYNYELPIGPSKALLAWTDWRRYFVQGWTVSGMSSISAGDPLYFRPQFNNTGGVVDALRVSAVPGIDPRVPEPGPEQWFNPAAFVQPPDFTPGTLSRTHPYLNAPGNQNHDLSLSKRFSLDMERTVELSAVGFNFLNRANWNDPDTVIGSAEAPNINAGRIIGSRGGRVVQLGIRYSF